MQCVILAAGRGKRMGSLTDGAPKALLEVSNKTLIEHKLDALPEQIDEVIIVVGYLGSVIHDYLGGSYGDKKLFYEEQDNIVGGTADALWQAKNALSGKFLVMMGDDIYAHEDITRCLVPDDGWALLVQEEDGTHEGGIVVLDKDHHIREVAEGAHEGKGYISANLFVLDTRIFDFPMLPKSAGSNEYGLPQTTLATAQKLGIPFYAVKTSSWVQISTPEDLEKARKMLEKVDKGIKSGSSENSDN